MSVPWSGTATESVPQPPAVAVTQANALSLPSSQTPSITHPATQPDPKPMSNGSIAPSATPAAPVAAVPRPAVPAPVVNSNGKRELSPGPQGQPPQKTIKASHVMAANAPAQTPPPAGPSVPRPQQPITLPMGRGQGIDLRAEEEAARRAARSAVGGARFAGSGSRAKQTDLLGEQVLRVRLNRLAHEHGMAFDDEAMRILAMGAETRMRSLMESATRAQQHRVNSTHQHKPPMRVNGGKGPKPLWSQKITSDTGAVMAALANANRDENKAHRVARTERNARETELARAQAAAKEREARESGSAPDTGAASPASGAPPEEAAAGPARPRPSEPVFQAAPTFGGPPPPPKKSKGKKAAGRDMSAEVQAKITNQTATVNAGRKRYAWEMGGGFRPQVSSLLSGKRKKAEEEEKKDKEEEEEEAPPPPKKKRTVSAPHRRPVDVDVRGDKRGRDDTALTVVDVMFALERERSGRGMGTADEIVRRQYAKPGGPYGPWQ
ncbi:hypothetical protein CcaverHIS002_0107280 [Cutaneotrichosporon cavernicola]|uniref:Transcription initiation factor TFIID subunit 4 n=1 Tax=Cutaneotrichosporon cavernicola TaxID=279322 RepID=A0AA48IBW4_9TREE|nr:uncharacterized protein CcaverHIS019_0107240 [Cutaneotrichosporon cavernicola]BEI80199.1 hypothetical protein CcaverHIS002_0107280 [Cutaneotrichosporon cavernicola]BEI88006.1 hypothetical protein CcaverHIS019_0107240 [Cutaneotrichosporon cavernicola]